LVILDYLEGQSGLYRAGWDGAKVEGLPIAECPPNPAERMRLEGERERKSWAAREVKRGKRALLERCV
jgi:hypothetical protein